MTDLTERLAEKLELAGFSRDSAFDTIENISGNAPALLPLLLSEPELVAGLSPEAKREVLNQMVGANYRDAVSRGDKMEALVWLNALNYTAQVSP